MSIVRIVGFDAALANFGIAQAYFDTETGELAPYRLQLVVTAAPKELYGQLKSGIDMNRARVLYRELHRNCEGMDMCAAEVPSGSQSAASARALGMVVGVLASHPIPMVEVTQQDVKKAATGTLTASKDDMIEWAVDLYPTLNWPISNQGRIIKGRAEHLADALAVLHAAVKTGKVR